MEYIRLESWIGGEWLPVDTVSVTDGESVSLSFQPQHTESGYRTLIWEPLEQFLREYRDRPVVVMPFGNHLPVMFGAGSAGPFRLQRVSG
ncbi:MULTISPECIES: hypothetical protein [Streptomyces]|uniref:Uncharacterized protein n=1 Tax=Streptomyces lycii TaxID=2654337 RepID=A0ABQ7FC95_9ACTN|nr:MULTISPECIES: hypothetical protein [Streptomyces]KAF4406711.1 hypothetical protein GCU69_23535 [Streptomyces lycii]PGH51010.1 hypothetical protein CRI70_09000 [Streptomyces sp. Ru87]